MTLENDSLLHKRYRIIESLGQGGMGSVYRAMDENLGVDVAVKENLFTTDEYARQFRLEAVILANLRHPNLPRVSDHFVMGDDGQYLIMDFIEGEDLRQRMERLGVLTEDDVIQIGAAICDALNYLHTRKPAILHRDIKPGNIKITSDGHIYLVDFGLAKVVHGSQATTTGARAMTPGYSPPEQYGTGRTDPRTDIYSLGATLYASLTGIIPEDGLARAMDNAQLTPLRKRNPKVSRRLAVVIERAMSIDPEDRFQDADDFKKSLLGSKSRTQQLTGAYTVSPRPSDEGDGNDADAMNVSSQKRIKLEAAPSSDMESSAFVPPSKKRLQRASRRRWQVIWGLTALAFLSIFVSNYIYPGLLIAKARVSFPFLFIQPEITATPIQSFTEIVPAFSPTPLRTSVGTPIPTSILDVNTNLTPTEAFEPTPIGGEFLQIAFASTSDGDVAQIYITDLLGKNVAQITNMPEGACQPSWSPDGTRLIFISPCKDKLDSYPKSSMYIINADGTGLVPLFTVPGGDFEPDWSPDGKLIAFTSMRDGPMQIYTYKLEDNSVTRLITTEPTTAARQPAWSPDGKEIAYAFKSFGEVYQIWLMQANGKNQDYLLRTGDAFTNYLPLWSYDGTFVYFNERKLGPTFAVSNLMIYKIGSTEVPRKLSTGLASTSSDNIDISPNGFWIAFEGSIGNAKEVYFMTVTGANITRLTSSKNTDFDPAWRPILKP